MGRWHVRLLSPTNTVVFDDYQSDSYEDAFALAQTAYPGYTVQWAVREPDKYGVFRVPTLP